MSQICIFKIKLSGRLPKNGVRRKCRSRDARPRRENNQITLTQVGSIRSGCPSPLSKKIRSSLSERCRSLATPYLTHVQPCRAAFIFLWRLVVIATSGRRPKTLTIFGGAGSIVGDGRCFPTRWYFSTSVFDASRPLFWQREIHNLYT